MASPPMPSCTLWPTSHRSSLLVKLKKEPATLINRETLIISGPRRLGSVKRRASMASTSSGHRTTSFHSRCTSTSDSIIMHETGTKRAHEDMELGDATGPETQALGGTLRTRVRLRFNSSASFSTTSSITTLRPKSILKSPSSAPVQLTRSTACAVAFADEARDGGSLATVVAQGAAARPGQTKLGRAPLLKDWLADRLWASASRTARTKSDSSSPSRTSFPGQLPVRTVPALAEAPTRKGQTYEGRAPQEVGDGKGPSQKEAVRFLDEPYTEEAACLGTPLAAHKRCGNVSRARNIYPCASTTHWLPVSPVQRRRPSTPVSPSSTPKPKRSLHSAATRCSASKAPKQSPLHFTPRSNDENCYISSNYSKVNSNSKPFSTINSLKTAAMPVPLRTIDRNIHSTTPTPRASTSKSGRMTIEEAKARAMRAKVEKAFKAVTLEAEDLDLTVAFFESQHFEIWDMRDDICIAWPAELRLRAKDPARWENTPLVTPEISRIEVTCSTKAYCDIAHLSHPYSFCDNGSAYRVSYTGAECPEGCTSSMKPERGIHLGADWERTYWRQAPLSRSNSESGRVGRPELPASSGERGWSRKVWIPIPTRLFVKRETRSFVIQARIWVGGADNDVQPMVIKLGDELSLGDALQARAEMTVSHLRSERLMR
ncbi:hypothetical protein HGRIS_008758 [Hohenbuehelia grisea]|uniref:Uncharacterized protein n=1 Tax=Hohenbuehelia grisea TaxID=104357 RepID=A0ABR3J990_9AGAR